MLHRVPSIGEDRRRDRLAADERTLDGIIADVGSSTRALNTGRGVGCERGRGERNRHDLRLAPCEHDRIADVGKRSLGEADARGRIDPEADDEIAEAEPARLVPLGAGQPDEEVGPREAEHAEAE